MKTTIPEDVKQMTTDPELQMNIVKARAALMKATSAKAKSDLLEKYSDLIAAAAKTKYATKEKTERGMKTDSALYIATTEFLAGKTTEQIIEAVRAKNTDAAERPIKQAIGSVKVVIAALKAAGKLE